MDLRAGRTLVEGRYTLVRELGRGATGHVWEARPAGDGRSVALKCMPADAGGRAAAEREAEVAVRVKHPAVVRIHLTHEEEGLAIVVMEKCTGSLASRVVLDGPLAPEEALAAMVPVVEALGAAHAAGVIHRDVKPQNVLVRDDGSIALGDWGIARALFGGGGAYTTSLAVLGTLPYLAPELRKDARAAAPASDVYAAGITLAWLCLGEAPSDPFMPEGEDELRGRLPAPVVEVVLRACAWSASARYASALDMATGLHEARAALEAGAELGAGGRSPLLPRRPEGPLPSRAGVGGAVHAGAAASDRRAPVLVAMGGIAALLAAGVSAWTVGRGGAGGSASPTEPAGASAAALPACEVTVRDFLPQRALGPEETIAAAVDDLDGDGAPDVIFSNQAAESLTFWWGRAGGMPERGEDLPVGRVSGTVAVLDVDGDGANDLVVPHRDDAAFGVHRGARGRAFDAGVRVFQGPAPGNAVTVSGGDASDLRAVVFDADGFLHRRDTLRGAAPAPAGNGVGDGAWGAHRLIAQERTAGPPSVFTHAGRAWVSLRGARGWELRAASGDIEAAATLDLPAEVTAARFVVPWWEAGGARSVAAFVDESVVRVALDAAGAPRACRVGPWRALDPASPAAVADLDGDGAPDIVATLTCSGCTSNQVLARGVR